MSKIGNQPITIPSSVIVTLTKNEVKIKGKEGELSYTLPAELMINQQENQLIIKPQAENKKAKSLHGLYRQLIANAIFGVEKLWAKKLEVVGTGYNVKLQGEDLVFKVGYSHPVFFPKTAGIKYQVEGNNKVVVLGVDKQLVGEIAYRIKMIKKPDVYKGKGIKYEGEKLRIKPGKKAKAAGAA
jgi:large subunit ribosomal protein L6